MFILQCAQMNVMNSGTGWKYVARACTCGRESLAQATASERYKIMITLKSMCTSHMKLVAYAAVVALVKTGHAMVPFAPADHDVAYWLFTNQVAGTVCENPSHPADATTYWNKRTFATAVDPAFAPDAATYHVNFRTYGDGKVVFSDDVPGKYLLAGVDAVTPITDTYQSLKFLDWKDHEGKAQPSAWIEGFQGYLKNLSSWTLEFFAKIDVGAKGVDLGYFNLAGKESNNRVIIHFPSDDSTAGKGTANVESQCGGAYASASSNRSAVETKVTDLRDGAWHHIAITYEDVPDLDHGTGRMQIILDYQKATNYCRVARSDSTPHGEFRLRNSCGNGSIAAVRLSNTVLSPDQLLRASDTCEAEPRRIAFYPFDEEQAGWTFSVTEATLKNYWGFKNKVLQGGFLSAKQSAVIMGKAVENGEGGAVFTLTNDVPGHYIYPFLRARTPAYNVSRSLFMRESTALSPESPFASSTIQFERLARDLAATEEWTFEFFVKFCDLQPKDFHYMWLNKKTVDGVEKSQQIALGTRGDVLNSWYFSSKTDGEIQACTLEVPGISNMNDGRWHHLAYTVTRHGTDKKLRFYCDYTLQGSQDLDIRQNPEWAEASPEFRIGQGNMRGMIACVRATAKSLLPHEFQYASENDDGVLPENCWSWRFDGKRSTAIQDVIATEVENRIDNNQYLTCDNHAFCGAASGAKPIYAAPVLKGARMIGEAGLGRNTSSAEMSGGCVKATLTNALLTALGRSLTVETLADVSCPGSDVAVVGAETVDGLAAWCLFAKADGSLNVCVVGVSGCVVERKVMDGFCGAPHSLVLRADCLERTFTVSVDKNEMLALTANELTEPIRDGIFVSVGGGCGKGMVSGRIDEVRVNNRLLSDEETVIIRPIGFALVFR